MGKTLSEKILSEKSGSDASAGDIVIAAVDLVFIQDTTGPLTVKQFQASKFKGLTNPQKTVVFIDHAVPSPSKNLSNDHLLLHQFAQLRQAAMKYIFIMLGQFPGHAGKPLSAKYLAQRLQAMTDPVRRLIEYQCGGFPLQAFQRVDPGRRRTW